MKDENKKFLRDLQKSNANKYDILVGQAINLAVNNAMVFEEVIDMCIEYTKKAKSYIQEVKDKETKEERIGDIDIPKF